jgi:hypothetical protein
MTKMTADFSELWRPFVSLRFVSPVQATMPMQQVMQATAVAVAIALAHALLCWV